MNLQPLLSRMLRRDFQHTKKYLKMNYPNTNEKIRIGDAVIVHPTATSMCQNPFEAKIIKYWVNWIDYPCYELCTFVEDGYPVVFNDYLYQRLALKPKQSDVVYILEDVHIR